MHIRIAQSSYENILKSIKTSITFLFTKSLVTLGRQHFENPIRLESDLK